MPKFVKGQSGNPGGRPRADLLKIDLLAEIRRQLSSVDPESRLSKGSELVQALISMACGGDVRACQELLSRIHGKLGPPEPAEKLDLESVSRAMAERYKQIRPAGSLEPEPPGRGNPARGSVRGPAPPRCGLVELHGHQKGRLTPIASTSRPRPWNGNASAARRSSTRSRPRQRHHRPPRPLAVGPSRPNRPNRP